MHQDSESPAGNFLLREEGPLTQLVRRNRLLFTLTFFGLLAAISVTASFFLRFVVLGPLLNTTLEGWQTWWLAMLAVTVPVRLAFFWAIGLHKTSWRFASVEDLPPLVGAVLSSSALIIVALWVFVPAAFRFRPWPSTWCFAWVW